MKAYQYFRKRHPSVVKEKKVMKNESYKYKGGQIQLTPAEPPQYGCLYKSYYNNKLIASGHETTKSKARQLAEYAISDYTKTVLEPQKEKSALDIPSIRPDGASVRNEPPTSSPAQKKHFKVGDNVYGAYHDINRKHFQASGKIVGFTRNDVMIYDKNLESFIWVDGKNVYKLGK